MIVCSLNEVDGYARRAARGAGLSGGWPEEAGRATRWLCNGGMPGVAVLVKALLLADGRPYRSSPRILSSALACARWNAVSAVRGRRNQRRSQPTRRSAGDHRTGTGQLSVAAGAFRCPGNWRDPGGA